jgi:hypothetical protein
MNRREQRERVAAKEKVMRRKSSGWLPRLRNAISIAIVFVHVLGIGTQTFAGPAEEGGLSVVTDPAGASVYINGESKGVTPLQIDRIGAGDHRVTLVKDGYLENSRVVRVEPGKNQALEVQLTSSEGQSRAAQIQPGGGGGGGVPKWVWIAAAAGGGTAAYFLLRETNEPPACSGVSANPSTGLQAAQSFSFSAQCSDPDGDPLSYSWDLGDGSTGSGQNVTKVYNNAGSFTATATASDDKESATGAANVTVVGMTGNWTGSIIVSNGVVPFSFNLTQSGTTVTGSYSDADGPGTVTGNVSSPNGVSLTVRQPQFLPFTFTGTTSGDVNSVAGTVLGFPFTMRR